MALISKITMPRSCQFHRAYLLIVVVIGGICVFLSWPQQHLDPQLEDLIKYAARSNMTGCSLPKLDPFDKSVMKFYKKQYPIKCKQLQPNLIIIQDNILLWNYNAIKHHNLDMTSLKCQSRCVKKTRDDIEAGFGEFTNAPNGTTLHCDIIQVKCVHGLLRLAVYDKYLSYVVPDMQKIKVAPRGKPSIIFLIIDSQSRSNFIRQLPETYKYLINELDGIDFLGMNKAALSSYANCMSLFADEKVDPNVRVELRGPFDDKPLIFFNYSRTGYVTQFSSDWPEFDLFNYDWKGNGFLSEKPFDHYQRPLWIALWNSILHLRSTHLCYDNTPKHKLQLDYVNSLFEAYPTDVPKFSIAWINEVAHEFINDVGKMDIDLLNSVKSLKHHLNNSYLFIMGDHGHRYGPIRESRQGRYEDRLPFFGVALPTWFGEKYPDRKRTFQDNAKTRRLVTFYDAFAMLAEILHESIGADEPFPVAKGTSLFRPISVNRSCADIHIDSNHCSCYNGIDISMDHAFVKIAANATLAHVNDLISAKHGVDQHKANCVKYESTEIKHAQAMPQNEQAGLSMDRVMIIVNMYLKPGNVYIESTVTIPMHSKRAKVDSVDRINKYGNQSHCTNLRDLKPFCFCDDIL